MSFEKPFPKEYKEKIDEIVIMGLHCTKIFPTITNLTCTFTAHANANTWSLWTRIVDSAATNWDDLLTLIECHISAIMVESADKTDKKYMLEIGYGVDADHVTSIAAGRFMAGAVPKNPANAVTKIKSCHIPVGEKCWYKLMCETGGGICEVHLRYYCHN